MEISSGSEKKRFRFLPVVSGGGKKVLTRQPVRIVSGFPLWGMFLFGLPFFLGGCLMLATASGSVPFHGHSSNSPTWILFMAGALFFCAGPFLWIRGWREMLSRRRREERARQNPYQPALRDHPWNLRGADSPRWKPFFSALIVAAGMSCFLSIFNWWAFFSHAGPVMVKCVVGLFDLILVFLWWKTLEALIRGLKFGPARLTWPEFPQHPESVRLRWEPGTGMQSWQAAVFILRCIRETHSVVQTQKGREQCVSFEELWSQSDETGAKSAYGPATGVDLYFTAPAELPGTFINQDSPVYWELEVTIDVPGVDFQSRYLVPVYR